MCVRVCVGGGGEGGRGGRGMTFNCYLKAFNLIYFDSYY